MAGSNVDSETVKMEVDYSAEVERLIPECETMAMEGRLSEALDKLLVMEKQTRTAGDANSTGMILVCVVRVCFEAGDWPLLSEHIVMMTKRRGQLKQAVTKMIQQACTYVEKTPDLETKLKLIDTLRTVTEGKIYVEVERARLTRRLAQIEEEQGNISKAAKILQDQQVETFGSMEKREKVEFILEQMRLCLANHDYVRTQIISKKISVRFFDTDGVQDLKLKYYQLMIALGEHEDAYLTISRHYQAVLDTPLVREDPAKRQEALRNVVLYLLLAPFDNEQNDLVHRVNENKTLEEIPTYQTLLQQFITMELASWSSICEQFDTELRRGVSEAPATGVFHHDTDIGNDRWKVFHRRVVEHNIRVIASYYSRIGLPRMAQLLDLTESEVEEYLSRLVVNKTVFARTDRPGGVVTFLSPQDPSQVLNVWSRNLDSLMALVNKTTHLVTKEEMVHSKFVH